ncbi:hypothetical protein CC2G_001309 [Coprinopsis cinerea AmutBmut pab1-1]|nr:hypothetical protein CC2G_001309 [Coprinopsis cinerea AmutBmut pab1-1]
MSLPWSSSSLLNVDHSTNPRHRPITYKSPTPVNYYLSSNHTSPESTQAYDKPTPLSPDHQCHESSPASDSGLLVPFGTLQTLLPYLRPRTFEHSAEEVPDN